MNRLAFLLCLVAFALAADSALAQTAPDFVDQIPGGGLSITAAMAAALSYLGRRLLKQNEEALKRAYAELDKSEEETKRWQQAYIDAIKERHAHGPDYPRGGG